MDHDYFSTVTSTIKLIIQKYSYSTDKNGLVRVRLYYIIKQYMILNIALLIVQFTRNMLANVFSYLTGKLRQIEETCVYVLDNHTNILRLGHHFHSMTFSQARL